MTSQPDPGQRPGPVRRLYRFIEEATQRHSLLTRIAFALVGLVLAGSVVVVFVADRAQEPTITTTTLVDDGQIDSDGDGIVDSADECPSDNGGIDLAGCPDTDGDGVADPNDACRSQPAATPDGCIPETVPCIDPRTGNGDPYEPNNSRSDAAGPLRAGKAYRAVIENHGDNDWYGFCTSREGNVTVTIALDRAPDGCIGFGGLVTGEGGQPLAGRVYNLDPSESDTASFNAKADGRYYLWFDASPFECQDAVYRFRVDGAISASIGAEAGAAL